MIEWVKQEHRTGCGIACAAMLSGKQYSVVLSEAQNIIVFDGERFRTNREQMLALLKTIEVNTGDVRTVKHWSSLPDLAIIGINYHEETDRWHWVVFQRNGEEEYVLDPQSKRQRRTDFNRMRLKYCIPILSNCANS